MKNFFSSNVTSIILLSVLNSQAQNDSITRINRKYKREVGIDMSQLFQRNPGTALIFKLKNNSGRFVDLKSAKNYRFQIALSGSLSKKQTSLTDTSIVRYVSKAPQNLHIQAMLGIERVNFYGKFNFYYGVDAGPYYSYSHSGYTGYISTKHETVSVSWMDFPYTRESTRTGLAITPFIGAKYRFSEHFSLSVESGFMTSVFRDKIAIRNSAFLLTYSNMELQVSEEINTGINFSMNYLRFLTLNYHL